MALLGINDMALTTVMGETVLIPTGISFVC